MEYEDYVKLHKMFGKCDGVETLANPYTRLPQYETTFDEKTGILKSSWFSMTKNVFKLTQPYNSPYNIGFAYAYTEVPILKLLPKEIVAEYLNANEYTINGHRAHQNLVINHLTGKTIYFTIAAYPHTKEDKTKAISTLRKHVTAYKKKARPVYRLLEGSLTSNSNNENHTANWQSRKTDDLKAHELYEMLRLESPTVESIKLLVEKGNSSINWGSSLSETNFESAISRVIQRRRKDLQSFALLEANNKYNPPTLGVTNGTTS